MYNIELTEIVAKNMPQTPDLRPFYDPENAVHEQKSRVYTPEDLARLKYIDFPGVGACITAVVYSSEKDDVFALHIQQDETPEKINKKIQLFLDDPKYSGKTWTLDYLVRQNPKNKWLGYDSPKDNLKNLDNLADVEDHFPSKFDKVNVVYMEIDKPAESIGWNHQNHFMKVVYTPKPKTW